MHYLLALLLTIPFDSGWIKLEPLPPDPPPKPADYSSLKLQHGHLVDIPYLVDEWDRLWLKSNTAFLAVRLPDHMIPPKGTIDVVDYAQEVRVFEGVEYKDGAMVMYSQSTAMLDRGWMILPLVKPCAATARSTTVGEVTVCFPRHFGREGWPELVHWCLLPGDTPIYKGTPPETVPCGPAKRRAVR